MDELLKLLCENARETDENLARQLGIEADEVRARIAGYQDQGLIRGFQAILNEDALDSSSVTAVIEVKVVPEREGGFNHIAKRIGHFPEVTSLYLMSGQYDLMLFVQGDDLRQVAGFVSDKLASIPGITGTATHFMLKTYKHRGVLMEGHDDEDTRLKVSP